MAGVAQTHIYHRFAWQAWHSWHWVARLGLVWARVTPRHFAWQAWHNLTSTFVSRGRRGTNSHLPSFSVAGVALMALGGALGSGGILRGRRGTNSHLPSFYVAGVAQSDIHLRFTWQAWHSWHSVARLGLVWARVMPRHFAWQVWHNLTSTFILRGRRGTNSHLPSFHVAGVALMAWGGALGPDLSPVTLRLVAWQAWYRAPSPPAHAACPSHKFVTYHL